MVATLVWTEWMGPEARQIGFGVLVVLWTLAWLESLADWSRYLAEWKAGDLADQQCAEAEVPGAVGSAGTMREEGAKERFEERNDRLFREAQRQYLIGDWVRCEQLLRQLLKRDKRDIEARLMLATLWRHLDRAEEAARQLHRLEQFEAAAPWSHEIAREFDAIACQSEEPGGADCAILRMPTMAGSGAIPSGTMEEQPAQREQQQQTGGQSPLAA